MQLITIASIFFLPATLRCALAQKGASSSTACNNSPLLCDRSYDQVTNLGAHDSPFLRDATTDYTAIGNQFYNSSVQLSAGVRLLTAQIQLASGELHVCHTSCLFLDAGPLSTWLAEVRSWMESNPNEVVTLILVNGPSASASRIAGEYQKAGITTSLAYTPNGANSKSQVWPTLQSLISSGTRLLNFVEGYIDDKSMAPYLMSEYDYIFENNYDVTSPDDFSCDAWAPSSANGKTTEEISKGMLPLMNHFMDEDNGAGIETPAENNITTTNAPSGGVGTLGYSAEQCKQQWGRAPAYILVDYFNVGPAIQTVDRLNGVSNPVGRTAVSTKVLSSANANSQMSWVLVSASFAAVLALAMS